MGNIHEFLVDIDPVVEQGHAPIFLNNAQENGSILAG
jgi:hypothetical protein